MGAAQKQSLSCALKTFFMHTKNNSSLRLKQQDEKEDAYPGVGGFFFLKMFILKNPKKARWWY